MSNIESVARKILETKKKKQKETFGPGVPVEPPYDNPDKFVTIERDTERGAYRDNSAAIKRIFYSLLITVATVCVLIVVIAVAWGFYTIGVSNITQTMRDYIAGKPIAFGNPLPGAILVYNGTHWIATTSEVQTGMVSLTAQSDQLVFQSGPNSISINAQEPPKSVSYTVPYVGQDADFLLNTGSQVIVGNTTINGTLIFTQPNNQICFLSSPQNTGICLNAVDPPVNLSYTIQDVGKNTYMLTADGNYTVNGYNTYTSPITVTPTSNQIVINPGGGANQVSLSVSGSLSTSVTYTFPNLSVNANVLLDQGSKSVSGATTFNNAVTFTNSNALFVLQPNQYGITVITETLQGNRNYIIPDTGTNSYFVMSNTIQTLNDTVFTSQVTLAANIDQLVFQPGGGMLPAIYINVNSPPTSATYTIPYIGATGTFAFLEATQKFTGVNTFAGQAVFSLSSNQILIQPGGIGTGITITTANPTSSRTIAIPDPGAAASFVLTQSAQTIVGALTLSSALTLAAASNQLLFTGGANTVTVTVPSFGQTTTVTLPDPGQATGTVALLEAIETFTNFVTFSKVISISSTNNQLAFDGFTHAVSITATAPGQVTTLTIPDPGQTTASFLLSAGSQTITGSLTLDGMLTIDTTNPLMKLQSGGSKFVYVAVSTPANGIWTLLIPDTNGNDTFVFAAASQTITNKVLDTSEITTNTFFVDPTSTSKNLYIDLSSATTLTRTTLKFAQTTTRTLSFPDATDTIAVLGITQTFSGSITFSQQVALTATSNQFLFNGGSHAITVTIPSFGQVTTLTIPDPGLASATFAYLQAAQTFSGANTFSSALTLSAASNQIVFTGNTHAVTFNVASFGQVTTVTLPDPGQSTGTVALLEATETFTNFVTFSKVLSISSTNNQLAFDGFTHALSITTTAPGQVTLLTIPDPGAGSANFLLSSSSGGQTITGSLTLNSALILHVSSNQIEFNGNTNIVYLNVASFGQNTTVTLPDPGQGTGTIALLEATQTFSGSNSFSSAVAFTAQSSNQLVFSDLPSFHAVTISVTLSATTAVTITLPNPGSNAKFILSAGTGFQSIGTALTVTGVLSLDATSNQLVFAGNTNPMTINAASPASSTVITIPDPGTSTANFVLSQSTQTLAGIYTFTNPITITPISNQIVFGTGNTTTLNAESPAESNTITIPDPGQSTGTVALLEITQTFTNFVTFNKVVSIASTTNQLTFDGFTHPMTIHAAAPGQSTTITIQDPGNTTAYFILSENPGIQTINTVLHFPIFVTFATLGGVAADLSYYETYVYTANLGGIYTNNPTITVKINRIGIMVTAWYSGFYQTGNIAATNQLLTISAPSGVSRLLPTPGPGASAITNSVWTVNNGAGGLGLFGFQMGTGGITIYASITATGFTGGGAGSYGFDGFSISWSV